MQLSAAMQALYEDKVPYFRQYTHNRPLIMSAARYEETRQLGLVLHTVIKHLAEHYTRYLGIMPFSEEDLRILAACHPHPYRIGTFRTDFVIDAESNIRLIEITTRQPLNGYFISGIMREIAMEQVQGERIDGLIDPYPRFLSYLEAYIGDARHICVIKGHERMGEFKLYPAIFERAGIPCHVIPYEDLPQSLHLLEDAWIIEELNHREIRQLPIEIIGLLTQLRMHNDIRTIFFVHDKRFFYLLNHPTLLDEALDPAERTLLRKYLVPTYIYGENRDIWERAYHHRHEYILKHRMMGKSEQIYAGCVTDEATWKQLLDSPDVEMMVLQPFVTQRKFTGMVGDEPRDDYVAGTLLYFNEEFFGPGLYRASSFPVTNQADDRKVAQLVATVDEMRPGLNYLR